MSQHIQVMVKGSAGKPTDMFNCHSPSSIKHPLPGTVREQGESNDRRSSEPRTHFRLRWASGCLVGEFTACAVERFVQDLDEGLIPGVAPRDEGAGAYRLRWGANELLEGQWFTDYSMPDGAELTLVHDPSPP